MSAGLPRLALLGATGAVGAEVLRALEERRLELAELRVFASAASQGEVLEFRGESLVVEGLEPARVAGCGVVLCAAPGVLEALLPELAESDVIDVSGELELDPAVPLYLPGRAVSGHRVAIPRGIVTGLAAALAPLAADAGLERVTVTTLESASGAGRAGLDELREQTLHLLQALDGEAGDATVFPQALAFDCLPLVGELGPGDESDEERRLRHVMCRALARPALLVEATRVRVPVFMGALATVHARLEKPLALERVAELWSAEPAIRLLSDPELPTPRDVLVHDRISVGRVRVDPRAAAVSFVVGLDPLRRGAALGAVEVLEQLLEK